MLLLAFDPGETTGWALATIKPSPTKQAIQVHIEGLGEFNGITEFHALVKDPINAHPLEAWSIFNNVEVCIIEDYIIYPNRAASHSGSKVLTAREIGHIEYVAFTHGLDPVFQTASMAKQRWPDKRLMQYLPGLTKQGRSWDISKHKQDALRHLFTYIERTFDKPLEVV